MTYRQRFPVLSSFMANHWICNYSNTTTATCGTGTAYTSRAPSFSWVHVARSLVFCLVFWRSLFVLLSFFISSFTCLLSVLLRFTNSDYPFGIFKHFPWFYEWMGGCGCVCVCVSVSVCVCDHKCTISISRECVNHVQNNIYCIQLLICFDNLKLKDDNSWFLMNLVMPKQYMLVTIYLYIRVHV